MANFPLITTVRAVVPQLWVGVLQRVRLEFLRKTHRFSDFLQPSTDKAIWIRIRPRHGELLRDGNRVRHFCIVTNRSDPESGCGLDLIRWHRQKAGTIEHAHDVLMNELAGAALPSQKFGANAAWLRLNVILYNLLSAYKRVGLPEEFHTARPKRLRFLLLNTVGKVVRHARETLLRCTKQIARALAGPPRTRFALKRPALAGV